MWRSATAAVAAAVLIQSAGAQSTDLDRVRAMIQQAQTPAVAEYLARHGITEPDAPAKYEVARRRGVLFAVILDECWQASRRHEDFLMCLDQREKAETWLGNALDEPQ
jgi:hypothetical protein